MPNILQPSGRPAEATGTASPAGGSRSAVGVSFPVGSSRRIPALDGLRGIAILEVLLWHAVFNERLVGHPWLNGVLSLGCLSWSGVDLFFVLSGFLIGGILLDNRESPNFFKAFYLRRAYRILPLYAVVVAFCFIFFEAGRHGWTPRGMADWFRGPVPWWSYVVFLQNWCMPFIGGFGRAGINVTWSLAIEEQFYLTLPLIVRRVAPKNLLPLVVGIVVGAPVLRALLIWYLPHGGFAAYVLTPCRADALGLGVLCAILVRGERSWSCLLARRAWICASAVLLGLGIGGITLRAYPQFSGALYGTEYSVLALFYAAVLLIAVTGEGRFVEAVFCNSVLRGLGFVAYGTYLLHSLFIDLFVFLANFLNARYWPMHFRGAPLLGEVVAVAIAALSWRYFEKPLVRKGHAYPY